MLLVKVVFVILIDNFLEALLAKKYMNNKPRTFIFFQGIINLSEYSEYFMVNKFLRGILCRRSTRRVN